MKYLLPVIGVFMLQCSSLGDHKEDLMDDTWMVVSIKGDLQLKDSSDASPPILEIHPEESLYSGNDGCNNFHGGITEFDKKTIKFGNAAATRMMCGDMTIPDLFNRTLAEVVYWEIKKGDLYLSGEKGNELMLLKSTR